MTTKYFVFIGGVGVVAIAVVAFFIFRPESERVAPETVVIGSEENAAAITFSNPKKSAHYESNTPAHGAILALPPLNVVIDVNFDLSEGSAIAIENKGKEYGMGPTTIDGNRLTMRRAMTLESPDGLYTVTYRACWPDKSCHDGHFQFAIDRSAVKDFLDLRNQAEVIIRLSDIAFKPQAVRISKGTKVTWINDEEVEHFVNTDAHPSHTYFVPQNSRALAKGSSYSFIFDKTGVYSYHCSAHASIMTGTLLVE